MSNPYKFTSREYDGDTGLYYYRARYYDANVGRFLSKDPLGKIYEDNLYVYVKNNPLKYTDPTGNALVLLYELIPGYKKGVILSGGGIASGLVMAGLGYTIATVATGGLALVGGILLVGGVALTGGSTAFLGVSVFMDENDKAKQEELYLYS